MNEGEQVGVIGAGPAGLTAAYELAKHGRTGFICEADSVVGGISKTVVRDGYRFDIGGHRFFTKVTEIEQLWREMLGEPLLVRQRMSRIYYQDKFYDYPLKAGNALRNMGVVTAAECMLSYVHARLRPVDNPRTYEQWVVNQFGRKLYEMFFKSYTEKVWGIPCHEIGADWAAQRIKGLNLWEAVRSSLFGARGDKIVTSLIDQFQYPELGPGQIWERCASAVVARGWNLLTSTRATSVNLDANRVQSVVMASDKGERRTFDVAQLISSMPLRELILCMNPAAPPEVRAAAERLKYRDFMLVALVLDAPSVFPDNWIYIHSSSVRVGRIQNFKNWSPSLVPDQKTTCLGLEYFVNEGDDLWCCEDELLVARAYEELQRLRLAQGQFIKGYVVRVPKAYPVYDMDVQAAIAVVHNWVTKITNLSCVGRNGQHRYNNQDHSMATALIAARNIVQAERRDPWAVNQDAEYHEISKTDRVAPNEFRA